MGRDRRHLGSILLLGGSAPGDSAVWRNLRGGAGSSMLRLLYENLPNDFVISTEYCLNVLSIFHECFLILPEEMYRISESSGSLECFLDTHTMLSDYFVKTCGYFLNTLGSFPKYRTFPEQLLNAL